MTSFFIMVALISLAGLLLAKYREDKRLEWLTKPTASLMFLLTGLYHASQNDAGGAFELWIVVGLFLGMVGDVLLIRGEKKAWFIGGLLAFLAGHLAYILGMNGLLDGGAYTEVLPLAALAILMSGGVFWFLRPHLGPMAGPVLAYVLIITAMVWAAMAVYQQEATYPQDFRRMVAAGALLFYASDLAVALDTFRPARIKQAYWGLPLYYLAQFLFAFAINPIP